MATLSLVGCHRTILSTEKRGASPSELERLKNGTPLPELNLTTTLSLQRGAVGFGNGVMSDSDDDVEVFHRSKSPMEYPQVCIPYLPTTELSPAHVHVC